MARTDSRPASPGDYELTEDEQESLVRLARRAIEDALADRRELVVDPAALSPGLTRKAACFVTLHEHGELRGCMGTTSTHEPLYRAVIGCAVSSATRDMRFPCVSPEELPEIDIEVSVLTPTRRLSFRSTAQMLEQIEPCRHGVVLRKGWQAALYLPQVWDQFDGAPHPKEAFLASLSRKAGDIAGTLWKQPGVEVSVFEALKFGEGLTG